MAQLILDLYARLKGTSTPPPRTPPEDIEMEDLAAVRFRRDKASHIAQINEAAAESPEIGGADVLAARENMKRAEQGENWSLAHKHLDVAKRKAALVQQRKPYLTAKLAHEPKIKAASKITKKISEGEPLTYGAQVKTEWEAILKLPAQEKFTEAGDRITALAHRIDTVIAPALKTARDANALKLAELKEELQAARGNPEALRTVALAIFKNTTEAEELGIDSGENARKPFTEEPRSDWTAANCEATFRRYDWFALKQCRKEKTITLGEAERPFSDDDMWKLVQYRGKVVNEELDKLRQVYPTLIAKASGSEDIESDIDITIATPRSGDDVKAAKEFNQVIISRFGKPAGRVFDVNIYPRDYGAIKESFKPDYNVDGLKDENIDEPDEPESMKLSKIDQDVATLLKQRRFLETDKFNEMLQDLINQAPDEQTKKRIEKQYEEGEDIYLQTSLEKVTQIRTKVNLNTPLPDEGADKHRLKLLADIKKLDDLKGKGGAENLKKAQLLVPEILDLFEETYPAETMDVTDALYLEKMGSLREDQETIRTLKEGGAPDKHHPGETCEVLHPGVPHETWLKSKLNSLEVKVKKDMFTNIVFANEAIISQGALKHVVEALQASSREEKLQKLAKLTATDLMQSVNEQVADLFKEMKHFDGVVEEAVESAGEDDKAAARNRANGEGYVHASKYFFRLLDAAISMTLKYPIERYPVIHAPYEAVSNRENKPLEALKTQVDDVLLKLRKSAVIPPEIKGEVGALEMQEIFPQVRDIPTFRTMITNFAIELNKRIRSLDEFKQSQEMDTAREREAERAYFETASPETATPGSKEDAENQIRIILSKPLVANARLGEHLVQAGILDGVAITGLWTDAINKIKAYASDPGAAPSALDAFASAVGRVAAGDVKDALVEAKDRLAEQMAVLKLAAEKPDDFRTLEADFAAVELEIANAETSKATSAVQTTRQLTGAQKDILEAAQRRLQEAALKLRAYDGKELPEPVRRRHTLLTNSVKSRLETIARSLTATPV